MTSTVHKYLLHTVPSRPVDNIQGTVQPEGVVVTWRGLTTREANGIPHYTVNYQLIRAGGTAGELMSLTTSDTAVTLPRLSDGDSYSVYIVTATGGGSIVGPASSPATVTLEMSKSQPMSRIHSCSRVSVYHKH